MEFDLGALLQQMWSGLVMALGGDVAEVVVVAILVFLGVIGAAMVLAIRRTEFFKQKQFMWETIDDHIADVVFIVALGDVDFTKYEERAQEREELGLSPIDPRMLYLMEQIEGWVKAEFNVAIDMEMLHARAERILDLIRNDPKNSVN